MGQTLIGQSGIWGLLPSNKTRVHFSFRFPFPCLSSGDTVPFEPYHQGPSSCPTPFSPNLPKIFPHPPFPFSRVLRLRLAAVLKDLLYPSALFFEASPAPSFSSLLFLSPPHGWSFSRTNFSTYGFRSFSVLRWAFVLPLPSFG